MPRLYESICKERLTVKVKPEVTAITLQSQGRTCLLMSIKKHCGTKDLLPAAQIESGSEEPLMSLATATLRMIIENYKWE